ncbi:hypothetical protein [Pseudotenacibaculum sp. MALMAid0570]|uniref:hypothetical protein n=1 Tax=Pseudotenacibaculum sp. MALMAid0570 TaxID=3143938 RepID=UPI0032DEE2B1
MKIKSDVSTRPELQMEKGDEFTINCQKCGKIAKIHVNDVKAEINKVIIIIGLVLGIVTTVFLWNYFGAIGTVSAIIPILFWQQQMRSVRSFNSYTIRRK